MISMKYTLHTCYAEIGIEGVFLPGVLALAKCHPQSREGVLHSFPE